MIGVLHLRSKVHKRRGDKIKVYKTTHDTDKREKVIYLSHSVMTWAHALKLNAEKSRTGGRKCFLVSKLKNLLLAFLTTGAN